MSCEAHILCYCEEAILPYILRHYATFCERIILHDAQSTDRSREIAKEYDCEIRDWRTDGVNDMLAKKLKEEAVMACKSAWCVVADADELVYFPEGPSYTLESYDAAGVAIVKPHGFEMVSDEFPSTESQIYDQVKMGARDSKWYAKPILVAPARIQSIIYSAGAHEAWATLKDGTKWHDGAPTDPPTYMLHCHHLGPIDRIGKRYAGQQSRHSPTNIAKKFGNFEDPFKHARDKRAMIMAKLEQVIR